MRVPDSSCGTQSWIRLRVMDSCNSSLRFMESHLFLPELHTSHEPPWLGARALSHSQRVVTLGYLRTA
jgi:hypothetical protein